MSKRTQSWVWRGQTFTAPEGMLSQRQLVQRGLTRNKTFRWAERGTITVQYVGGRRFFTPADVRKMRGKAKA